MALKLVKKRILQSIKINQELFRLLAIAEVESVTHALEDKNRHDAAYLRKHAQFHQGKP